MRGLVSVNNLARSAAGRRSYHGLHRCRGSSGSRGTALRLPTPCTMRPSELTQRATQWFAPGRLLHKASMQSLAASIRSSLALSKCPTSSRLGGAVSIAVEFGCNPLCIALCHDARTEVGTRPGVIERLSRSSINAFSTSGSDTGRVICTGRTFMLRP